MKTMKLKAQAFESFKFPTDYEVIKTVTLNKTDLKNGNNKFYQIEAHVSKDKSKYRLYSCYGRVGAPNPRKEERIPDQNLTSLEMAFDSLLKEKTSSRKGYKEVKVASTKVGSDKGNQMILSDDIKTDNIINGAPVKKSAIKLTLEQETLVNRLYQEAGQGTKKQLNTGQLKATEENPLGTLTQTQIDEGREILQEIQVRISKNKNLINTADSELVRLSSLFYTTIPQVLPMRPNKKAVEKNRRAHEEYLELIALNNATKLDDKEDMLELLGDVKGMINGFATTDVARKYQEIGAKIDLLPKNSVEYKNVEKYVKTSKSKHHNWSSKVVKIWRIDIAGQKSKNAAKMDRIGNIKPLFHGSRSANILGICKNGLLMRPPGVYITGSMFGNGLYFADQASKSEQYSMARFGGGGTSRGNTMFMFVADVALGKVKKYQNSQSSLTAPPSGYHSVQGEKGYSLLHNEFIVYNTTQNILQYMVEFTT